MMPRIHTIAGAALILAAGFSLPVHAAGPTEQVRVMLEGEDGSDMAIKLDKVNLKSGPVEFVVTNNAKGTDHEVVLVKLKSENQKIEADAKKHLVNESALKSLGEVAGLAPGAGGKLKVDLKTGNYMLLCNEKGHFEAGISLPITVTN